MLRTLHKVNSLLLIALGVVHTSLTPVFYGRSSLGALWFAGSGLAIIFLGLLNVALSRAFVQDRLMRVLCYAANVVTTIFGALVVAVDSEPQVIFGLVLMVLMSATAFTLKGAPQG